METNLPIPMTARVYVNLPEGILIVFTGEIHHFLSRKSPLLLNFLWGSGGTPQRDQSWGTPKSSLQ